MAVETERVTLRLPVSDLHSIDHFIEAGEFMNRSDVIRAAIKDFRSNFVPSEGAAAFKEKPAEALTDEEKEALKKFRRPTPDEIREKAGPAGESSVQLPG